MFKIMSSNCARCGKIHNIGFKKFSKTPIKLENEVYRFWGICKNTNEPVILDIEGEHVVLEKESKI